MSAIWKIGLLLLVLTGITLSCSSDKELVSLKHAEELLANGELTKAESIAAKMLNTPGLSVSEKEKLDSIVQMTHRIRLDFTLNEEQVLGKLKKYNPTIDQKELSRLESMKTLEMRMIDGKKSYFKNSVANLFRLDSTYARLKVKVAGTTIDSLSLFRLQHTKKVIGASNKSNEPVCPVRMQLTYTIKVDANAVPAGETVRCWMPFPIETNARQKEIKLIKTEPSASIISPSTDLQRSVYLEKTAVKDQQTVFQTVIEVTAFAQSFQLTPEMIRPYQKDSPVYKEFTAERPPQIRFTPQMKDLAGKITGGISNPLLQVKKIYQWINDSITWASALEYSIIPDIPGYVVSQRHGDCGMQTLLFMTLARSQGIPVKWQSGWMLHPGEVNLHDWCEVWFEGFGWVPLDQSFGLQNSDDPAVKDFYITGIDSYRLIVNEDYSRPFSPPKKFFRSEPYDFQRGEVEWKGGNIYFNQWDWHMEVRYLTKEE